MKLIKRIFSVLILTQMLSAGSFCNAADTTHDFVLPLLQDSDVQEKLLYFSNKLRNEVVLKTLLVSGVIGGAACGVGGILYWKNNHKSGETKPKRTQEDLDREYTEQKLRCKKWVGVMEKALMITVAGTVIGVAGDFLNRTKSGIYDFISQKVLKTSFNVGTYEMQARFAFNNFIQSLASFNEAIDQVAEGFDNSLIEQAKEDIIRNYEWLVGSQVELFGFMSAKAQKKSSGAVNYVFSKVGTFSKMQNQLAGLLEANLKLDDEKRLHPQMPIYLENIKRSFENLISEYHNVVLKS